MKFLIYFRGSFEVEAPNEQDAKKNANATFKDLESKNIKVEDPKVADPATGYFV